MTRLTIALFNYLNGRLQPQSGYDFRPLQHAFVSVDGPPPRGHAWFASKLVDVELDWSSVAVFFHPTRLCRSGSPAAGG